MRVTPARVKMDYFRRHFFRKAAMRPATLARVLALGVSRTITQSRSAGSTSRKGFGYQEQPGGPYVSVLIERLADGEPKTPERNVIRNIGRADRAEVNGIEPRKA